MPVPMLPANGNLRRDSAYPANRPQISEITVETLAISIVFSIHVLNNVSVSRSRTCSIVGCSVQNGV